MKTVAWLMMAATLCAAQKQQNPDWNFKSEERVSTRGCANLTLVLDNWKYAIMTQVKDLLLHDHSTVLPDYGRIQPLSDALGDLYNEFNALKGRLGELSARFEGVEAFVDEARAGRRPAPPGLWSRAENSTHGFDGSRPQGRRHRVVVRRISTRP